MSARAGGDGDEAVGALLHCLFRERVVDDVVEDDAAVGVDGVVDVGAGAEGGDDDGNLELDDGGEVLVEAVVALVDDQVDRVGGGRCLGVVGVVFGEFLADTGEPFAQDGLGSGVEGGEGSDDAGDGLGDD